MSNVVHLNDFAPQFIYFLKNPSFNFIVFSIEVETLYLIAAFIGLFYSQRALHILFFVFSRKQMIYWPPITSKSHEKWIYMRFKCRQTNSIFINSSVQRTAHRASHWFGNKEIKITREEIGSKHQIYEHHARRVGPRIILFVVHCTLYMLREKSSESILFLIFSFEICQCYSCVIMIIGCMESYCVLLSFWNVHFFY